MRHAPQNVRLEETVDGAVFELRRRPRALEQLVPIPVSMVVVAGFLLTASDYGMGTLFGALYLGIPGLFLPLLFACMAVSRWLPSVVERVEVDAIRLTVKRRWLGRTWRTRSYELGSLYVPAGPDDDGALVLVHPNGEHEVEGDSKEIVWAREYLTRLLKAHALRFEGRVPKPLQHLAEPVPERREVPAYASFARPAGLPALALLVLGPVLAVGLAKFHTGVVAPQQLLEGVMVLPALFLAWFLAEMSLLEGLETRVVARIEDGKVHVGDTAVPLRTIRDVREHYGLSVEHDGGVVELTRQPGPVTRWFARQIRLRAGLRKEPRRGRTRPSDARHRRRQGRADHARPPGSRR